MRHITLVTHEYFPMEGGVALSAHRVAKQLSKLGHNIRVVVLRLSTQRTVITRIEDNIPITYFDIEVPSLKKQLTQCEQDYHQNDEQMFNCLLEYWRINMCDTVLSFFVTNTGVAALKALKLARPKAKFIACLRGNDAGRAPFDEKIRERLIEVIDGADAVAAVAPDLLSIANELSSKEISSLIPNSYTFSAIKRKSISKKKPVLGSLAIFREKKGMHLALKYLQELSSEFDFEILLIGDFLNEQERQRHEIFWQQGPLKGRVRVTGMLVGDRLLESLKSIDLFLAPSLKSEGCPNAVLQAMAVGLPLVTSDAGCLKLMAIENINAWSYSTEDISGLKTALHHSPKLYE